MKLSVICENVTLIQKVGQIIPAEHQAAWNKGLEWPKRRQASLNVTAKNVAAGKWTLLYGWRSDIVEDAAIKFGLELIHYDFGHGGSIGFNPANEDMAKLMVWGHSQGGYVQHTINGVLLSYPLEDVESWVQNWMIVNDR